MTRPTIAVGLPARETQAVLEVLEAAEFTTITLESPEDLAALVESGRPIGLALLDAGDDPSALLDIVGRLRQHEHRIPLLVVTHADHLEVLLDEGGLSPDDEVVLRPIDADGLRWRAEAMLIRGQIDGEPGKGAVLSRGHVEASWATLPNRCDLQSEGGRRQDHDRNEPRRSAPGAQGSTGAPRGCGHRDGPRDTLAGHG